jgi:hypothetical protein
MRNARRAPLLALLLTALTTAPAAAQSRDLDSYLLFALEGMRTKGLSISSGHLGVNDPNGAIFSAHGTIDAPESDIVAGMVRASVRSRCRHLYANNVPDAMAGCQPPGDFRALALPLMSDVLSACHYPSPFPDQCATASPVIVDLDSQRTLPPGTYGNVVVFSAGSRSGRLVLTGGDYLFCSLRTSRSARILFQGPSTVKIQNEVSLGATAYLGPDPGVSPLPSAGDITLYVNGPAVLFSASSEAHAHVYAPNAMLRLTHYATIEGTFLARLIRTERIGGGPSTTSTTSTTTTTRPGVTTTTTTANCGSLCGNGHIDTVCHEQCDGSDFGDAHCPGSSADGAFLSCRPDCTIDFSGCPTTTTIPAPGLREICANCIDDDNNGLTDFEDPACCAGVQSFAMTVRRGQLRPRGTTSRLRLKTTLAETGLASVNPLQEDVFLQIRPAGGTEVLCAKIPHDKFMRMHGAFKFWDHKHLVASAKGIDDLTVKVRRDGSVRLRTVGNHVQFRTPLQNSLQVTVGFYDAAAGDGANRCSTETRAFRTGRSGRLIAP